MTNQQRQLIVQQMDKKLSSFKTMDNLKPETGWIKAIRNTFNMTVRQFAKKLDISASSASSIESRESTGSITLKSLEEAGKVLNMKLVYGFIPMEGSIQQSIDKQARQVAEKIVLTTSHNMALEDQTNSKKRLQKAIDEKTAKLIREMPKYLWD